jgi:three-Cys-motif partner protein
MIFAACSDTMVFIMDPIPQGFGGTWTEEKLERVRKYLFAYATIMNRQKFRFAYIDAFAGTGYRTLEQNQSQLSKIFPEVFEQDSQQFLDGSARIALQVRPRFGKYIFIERDLKRISELEKLKSEFSDVRDDIVIVNADANSYLQDLCLHRRWTTSRAVLFLDPFGMQVTWETIVAIAKTKAIDLWILFPISAVNRLLTRSGQMSSGWRNALNAMFGSSDWYDVFYATRKFTNIFGTEQTDTVKLADFDLIGEYFVKRLKTEFAGVAENPLPLLNSRNSPLYLLCFASANPRGSKTAIRIAQDILKR